VIEIPKNLPVEIRGSPYLEYSSFDVGFRVLLAPGQP